MTTVEERIRKRRREAAFAKALVPLEKELDALQAMLAEAIREFEAVLAQCLETLPAWADVRAEVEKLYETEVAGQVVTMGPRAAAVAAARVDEFIRVWLSSHNKDARPDSLDDEAAGNWRVSLGETAEVVASVAERGRASANDAEKALSNRLDELLADLEEERASEKMRPGLDDLKRKLKKGQVGAALLERESKADSWEEQRRRADELREAWELLEELAFTAAEISVDASERLEALLRSAVEAIVDGYPELAAFASGWVAPKVVRKRVFNVPSVPAEDRRGSPSSRPDVDNAHRVTEPIGVTRTEEYSRGEELPLEGDEQPDPLEFAPVERAPAPRPPPTPASQTRPRADTDAPRMARDTPSPNVVPAAATVELIPAHTPEFNRPAHRTRVGWIPVTAPEMALVVGPPSLYIAFMAGAALAFRLGMWGDNPFRRWPWALTIFIWVALYGIAMPAFLKWRVQWRGYRPTALRLTEHRQEAFVEVEMGTLCLAGRCFDFSTAAAELGRWKTATARGWILRLTAADGTTSRLTSDATSQRWTDAAMSYGDELPAGCWEVSEDTLLELADRCVG